MNTVKHTPTKWFLTMREMKEGDHHAEITLSKDSGYAEDSDEYMRVSGICSLANAKKMVAAPELLDTLIKCHKHLSFLRDSIEGDERLELDESLDSILVAIKKATE